MGRRFRVTVGALFCALFMTSICRGGGGTPEISHEQIAVTIDPAAHLLTGASTVTLLPRGTGEISFVLYPGATVLSVTVEGRAIPFDFSGGTLVVRVPADPAVDPQRMTIAFCAVFNDPVPERIVTSEDPTYGVNGVISARGVFLGGGTAWYPRPPVLPAKRSIKITTPVGMEAITAGRRLEWRSSMGQTTSVWREEHPAHNLSLSAGSYLISERKLGALPLFAYFSADNVERAPAYLEASADYLKFYEGLFGPYPFEKFAIVENFIPTGYGFPSYTLLGGTVIRLPFIISTSLPHEIAHNWWGNGVLVDDRSGNWSEGLVTYVADYLLEEKKSPAAGRDYRMRILSEYASLVSASNDFPLTEFVGRTDPPSRVIGYGKAAMVFHMVRKIIGDTAFFGALRELCREELYKKASWDDFVKVFSRAAGKDMTPFMAQWLKRPGGPRVSLAEVASRFEGGKWMVSGKIIQAAPFWTFPVRLKVETADVDVHQTIMLDRESMPFTLTFAEPPRKLVLDPDVDLFRILSREEIPLAINRLKGAERLIAVVSRGCRARQETVGMLLESLGHPGARIVHEDEVVVADLAGYDLLICGIPERQGLLPLFPAGVTASRTGFAVDHETFGAAADALFVVAGHPSNRERVASLFVPLSATAADACVAKITHYGRYGLLVFSEGNNRKKGLPPAAGGGTAVDF